MPSSPALAGGGRHRDDPAMRAALRHHADGNAVRQVCSCPMARSATSINCSKPSRRCAATLARVHGGDRLRAELLSDDPRRRTGPRHLRPYRLGRAGRERMRERVRQARKPGGDAIVGDLLRHESGHDAGACCPTSIAANRWFCRQASASSRHDRHQGPDRRSALAHDAAARQRGRGQGPVDSGADGSSIVRYDQSGIDAHVDADRLTRTSFSRTCWPFEAIAHGPMRYALHATMISRLDADGTILAAVIATRRRRLAV